MVTDEHTESLRGNELVEITQMKGLGLDDAVQREPALFCWVLMLLLPREPFSLHWCCFASLAVLLASGLGVGTSTVYLC